jgi:hypothetical protein
LGILFSKGWNGEMGSTIPETAHPPPFPVKQQLDAARNLSDIRCQTNFDGSWRPRWKSILA